MHAKSFVLRKNIRDYTISRKTSMSRLWIQWKSRQLITIKMEVDTHVIKNSYWKKHKSLLMDFTILMRMKKLKLCQLIWTLINSRIWTERCAKVAPTNNSMRWNLEISTSLRISLRLCKMLHRLTKECKVTTFLKSSKRTLTYQKTCQITTLTLAR